MQPKVTNYNKSLGVSAIAFMIYCFYYISGYTGQGHNYIIMGLFLLWSISAWIEDSRSLSLALSSKCILWLLCFLIFYFLTSITKSELIYTLEYLAVYLFLYGTVIQFRYYMIRNRIREIQNINYIIMIAFAIFSSIAILFYVINPSAARTLASDFYAYGDIAIGGGYSIAFGSALLVVYFFEIVLRENKTKISKLILVILMTLFFVLVIKTESTITIIAMLLGMVYCIIRKIYFGGVSTSRRVSRERKIIAISSIIVLTVLVLLNTSRIGGFLMESTQQNVESNVVMRRIHRIGEKLYYSGIGESHDNYVDERLDTIGSSWNTFVEHPLLGVGYKCGNEYSKLEGLGVGTHSELLDTFAQFGIVGGGIWLAFIISALKQTGRRTTFKGYYVTLTILLLLNPFKSFHGFIVLFFVIPTMNYVINSKREENKYEQS